MRSGVSSCIGALVAVLLMAGSSSSEAFDKPATAAAGLSATDETHPVSEGDLVFSFVPIAPPVRPGKTPILVGVENRSKYPLRFSLVEDWVKGFSFFYRDRTVHPAGGGDGWAATYDWAPGTTVCHLITNLLVVPPGGTIFRGGEIDLSRAGPGTVNLTVKVQLMEVPVDLSCAHTRMLSGQASQVVEIVKNNKR